MNLINPRDERDYIPIADHALIGNLRTAALVSLDGSIESYCVPNFDSPSIFARILDKNKGGHFSINPTIPFSTKQNYLPSSNVLQTKFMNDSGVVSVTDFLPRPRKDGPSANKPLLPWLIRRVECIRGSLPMIVQCAPAFNYARSSHTTTIIDDDSIPSYLPKQQKALFMQVDLRYVVETTGNVGEGIDTPDVQFEFLDLEGKGHRGLAVQARLVLVEGQAVTFVLRTPPHEEGVVDAAAVGAVGEEVKSNTNRYWYEWISQSTYKGDWKEAVLRSALALKLLIYEPTGAVVASPTFSLPEYIGGVRNWDYRASWIRDSSFTLYALIRLGFTEEADSYMEFIFDRLRNKNPDGSLQIMYTIHGTNDLEEIELDHLEGHKGSRPVRVGNGAASHVQLDIYGELMDCIYLGQKFGKPLVCCCYLSFDAMTQICTTPLLCDSSIWEVRDSMRNFTYSKIMLWVALDRGLRLADKRSLPCPNRNKWLEARDKLYEDIMAKSWNAEQKFFGQSYEDTNVLDAAVLIMPLVFFMQPSDPRFVSTLKQILKTPEKGGLTSNGLVYRYDVRKSEDGVGGEEGTFCLCTLWCVEALTRAGKYDRALLVKAVTMFEDFLLYLNHVGLCTEEISDAGEALGNAVQGFTHVTLISAAYNLSRTLHGSKNL
ncbi:glycoside hydrolase family 15 protein [Panaeolus papilionaceus]|nr:glycoside hydrolase family 15 protein [Panaeolus papilionaceus]